MGIPGLLIEYLINGALALPWLYPLVTDLGVDISSPTIFSIFVVGLYGVGMVVDFFAYWLVKPLKPLVHRVALRKLGSAITMKDGIHGSSTVRAVKFALYAPELAKEVAMRGSRDRIARGAIVNVMVVILLQHALSLSPTSLSALTWVAILLVSMAMWSAYEYMSFSYELIAENALDEKVKP